MSIQSKLRDLLQGRDDRGNAAGLSEVKQGHAAPKPGHPVGAEGGDDSPSADKSPALPTNDGSPLGDTDQHSKAYRPSE